MSLSYLRKWWKQLALSRLRSVEDLETDRMVARASSAPLVSTEVLASSASLLRATLECTPDAVVVVDLHHRVVVHNQRYLDLWNPPPGVMELESPLSLRQHIANQLIDGGRFLRSAEPDARARVSVREEDYLLRDGRILERYVTPHRLAGEVVGTVYQWRDVTVQRRTAAALQAQQVAEQAHLAKNRFLSRMSHELRTPLNAIIGFSSVLQMDESHPLSELQRKWVTHVHNAGGHLLGLIDEVLDVTRLEAGDLRIEMTEVDALAVAQDAVAQIRAAAASSGVSIVLVPPTGRCGVMADPQRLRQALLNLLSNAVKYNRVGGTVSLRFSEHGDRRSVHVIDTGLGMSEEQLSNLFQPFNRLGRERSDIEGHGIGLVIVKQLVDRMGARISVQSSPGVGSEFVLDLGAAGETDAPPLLAEPASDVSVDGSVRGRVLYIEDTERNRDVMKAYFAWRPGVELHTAPDGARGIAAARTVRPQLVLIDMLLPDMDGVAVLQDLRRLPGMANLPCVAVSADAMPERIARATEAGFNTYLTKPVALRRLLDEVDAHLRSPNPD